MIFKIKLTVWMGVLVAALGLIAGFAQAQSIPVPLDQPYPGTLVLDVDLTDLDQKIMRVHETLPAQSGPLTLLYPRWLPGTHSPTGAVSRLAGLQIAGNGKTIEWKRDPVDVFAFHLVVPVGVNSLDIVFQHLSPISSASGRVVMTSEIIGLQWNTVVLYPAGFYDSAIQTQASVKLPANWQHASALDVAQRSDNRLDFKPVSLERLVDSPLWAGKHMRRIELDSRATAPVFLSVFADTAAQLEATPEHIDAHKQLVLQADAAFGSRHFARYEFLLAISEYFSGIGLEHSESSENAVRPGYFTEWKKTSAGRDLLPHEFAHSWNGKFRRPSDLWTANFNQPMQDSLLWIYEGQTQFWGFVLAARSGIVPLNDALDNLARTAAGLHGRSGRAWRNLQDTTNEPIISGRGPQDWRDWQRSEEYYNEGQMIWLDADSKIRELTQERKSLNDVATSFFGIRDGQVKTETYSFDDYVQALSAVVPLDWAQFLRQRLDTHSNTTILDGITRGGWKLVYTDKQSDHDKSVESTYKFTDYTFSLGFNLDKDGKFSSVRWDGPAFKAGLAVNTQLVAVNSQAYTAELLREAITQARNGSGIELLVKINNLYKTVKIDYRDGLRYPKLERIEGTPDRLTALLSARK